VKEKNLPRDGGLMLMLPMHVWSQPKASVGYPVRTRDDKKVVLAFPFFSAVYTS